MRRIEGNSELKTKAKLVVVILVLAAARVHAQQAAKQQDIRLILVSVPDRKLALIENGEVKMIYPVAVGREATPSPDGTFRIINRVTNPTYYHKGEIIQPGPENPVGTRWIGLSEKGYGIHGTNVPRSIGKAISHGCIRMERKDLESLFAQVRIGDVVEIRSERDSDTAAVFGTTEPVIVATAVTSTSDSNTTVAAR